MGYNYSFFLEPNLQIEISRATLRMSGKTPVERDRLNRSLKGLLRTWPKLTNNLWGRELEWVTV